MSRICHGTTPGADTMGIEYLDGLYRYLSDIDIAPIRLQAG
jgi:hypothetical protein